MRDDNVTARLCDATLPRLGAHVRVPGYDRGATRIGIVHLGAGAFHRAHQAVYIDTLLEQDPRWAICAVSLNSPGTRDALRPQDGLYTLRVLDDTTELRVIGAIREVLYAVEEGDAVLARLADPEVRLVTLTITEKGYCLAGDALDLLHPDIVHDLQQPLQPRTAIGYITAALAARRSAGIAPFTVLSCDNLPDNGRRLCNAVLGFSSQRDAKLAEWIGEHVAFPCTMVDSITPATDDVLRDSVEDALGITDAWPVQRERYTQWVVEARDDADGIPWHRFGVTLSDDVAGHERAKLRLLNAPHSAMAYLGLLLGRQSVADAMSDPLLSRFIAMLMRDHIAPNVKLPADLEAERYIAAILERFKNPHVQHRLAQIAQDGSQKLPIRFFGTISNALRAAHPIDALCLPIAAWLHHVRLEVIAGRMLQDPRADALQAAVRAHRTNPAQTVERLIVAAGWDTLPGSGAMHDATLAAYERLGGAHPTDVRHALNALLR